jgi:hypothetical protein
VYKYFKQPEARAPGLLDLGRGHWHAVTVRRWTGRRLPVTVTANEAVAADCGLRLGAAAASVGLVGLGFMIAGRTCQCSLTRSRR